MCAALTYLIAASAAGEQTGAGRAAHAATAGGCTPLPSTAPVHEKRTHSAETASKEWEKPSKPLITNGANNVTA